MKECKYKVQINNLTIHSTNSGEPTKVLNSGDTIDIVKVEHKTNWTIGYISDTEYIVMQAGDTLTTVEAVKKGRGKKDE